MPKKKTKRRSTTSKKKTRTKKKTTRKTKKTNSKKTSDDHCTYPDRRVSLSDDERALITQFRETGTLPDAVLVTSDMNAMKLKDKLKELLRRYVTAMEQNETLEKQLSLLIDLSEREKQRRIILSKSTKLTGQATAVMLASDWHLEERVDPSTVNNRNKYDLKEAERRVKNFFRKGLFLTDTVRKGIRINNLILALLGDIMTGYIHDEYIEDNYLSPTQTIEFATDVICAGVDFLLKEGDFDNIIVPCCIGNHGRTTKRKRVSTSYKNSYEWLLYKFLERIYRKNPKITFIVENGYHVYYTLYDKYRLRFHHGDMVRYQGGVGGITIPVNKAIAQWNRHDRVYYDFFGHFHQSIDNGFWISNGSLIGWNAYANSIKATFEDPQQTFAVLDQERGKIFVAPIFVK